MRPQKILLILTVLVAAMIGPVASASASSATGDLRFAQEAHSGFDKFTASPSPERQAWMRQHYSRLQAYASYFDSRTAWYSNAWAYQDAYAIYASENEKLTAHPDWVLKDGSGRRLYIPWGCSGGTCPQFAGDIGNPSFRAHWIAEAREKMRSNYRGLWVDDVNMEFRVGNGNGDEVAPVNPRTGRSMTLSQWKGYMADFMVEIRNAFPDKEIVHNAIWFSGHSDPDVARALRAADVVNLERGVVDGGITRGGGTFGYETFLKHVDWLHRNGKAVTWASYAKDRTDSEYNMASYFLTNGEHDNYRSDWRSNPDNWWDGYDVKLGAASGPRYEQGGLLRRDFASGSVLVNQPGSPTHTVATPGGSGPDGATRTSVTLRGGQGAVVLGSLGSRSTPVLARPLANPVAALLRTASRSSARPSAHRRAKVRKRARRAVLVRGKVRGARTGHGRVLISVVRRKASRWVRVRSARVAVKRNGRFSRIFAGLRPGRYHAKAKFRGTVAKARVSSRSFRIRP